MENTKIPREPQSGNAVLMVRPAHFSFNPQTAASNVFQSEPRATAKLANSLHATAVREFDAMTMLLESVGIDIVVAEDTADPVKPDAIFPNNWVSFHRDGTRVLYPMLAPNRRAERRETVLQSVQQRYPASRTLDLTHHEAAGRFLEGTGSLVLDRAHRIAYTCLSPRTDELVLSEFAQQLGYEAVSFEAADGDGRAVYHTNVVMAVGTDFAVVCLHAILNPKRRGEVARMLRTTGHDVLAISPLQMHCFAGNLLELETAACRHLALSTTAWESLAAQQRKFLQAHGNVLLVDIPVIERLGGGGVRCMMAEIHLAPRGKLDANAALNLMS